MFVVFFDLGELEPGEELLDDQEEEEEGAEEGEAGQREQSGGPEERDHFMQLEREHHPQQREQCFRDPVVSLVQLEPPLREEHEEQREVQATKEKAQNPQMPHLTHKTKYLNSPVEQVQEQSHPGELRALGVSN